MRVLVVEDDENKLEKLSQWLVDNYAHSTIFKAKSYSSGLNAVLKKSPDIVLLDMQMPTFDRTNKEEGGRLRYFAGRDIMRRIQKRDNPPRVIVVTQFVSFGHGEEQLSLEKLEQELVGEFPDFCLGTVFFKGSETKWQAELESFMDRIANEM